ncbi:protein GOLM2-like [Panonychus citri]|uniref:protein GOLM2-like n=1 Tax=Panonychus citri TaxID=50023 RepID=UPI002307F7B8|nr:protein GOLM2-like [Panonychus citri]
MGSSSGVARGQLRPQFAGRNPPFLVAGLFIALGLLGVSYFSLSSQYNSLHNQLENVIKNEERGRGAYQEKNKEYEVLQKLVEQLRERLDRKTNELKIKQSDLEKIRKSQQLTETNIAAEKSRLEIENKGLSEKTSQLQKSIDVLTEENIKLKSQLVGSDKQIKEKESKIEQLNVKINELSGKLSPDKQQDGQEIKNIGEDKDAGELKTEEAGDLGMADGDAPNAPGEISNKVIDGPVDGQRVKEDVPVNIDTNNVNPENHAKSSLSKLPKPLGDGEGTNLS